MPYTLIKGSYHIHYPDSPLQGPEPDGDTIKFKPHNRQLVENLPRGGRSPRFTQTGITTLRFEGIDALETHFSVEGSKTHQHEALALAARDRLLELVGFGAVSFFARKPAKVESVENHPIDGYILSNGLDTYGRAVSFAFFGDAPHADGASIFVEPNGLNDSFNVQLLRDGHAYGAFYLSLPTELRLHLREIVLQARAAKKGLWELASVTTSEAATVSGLDQLQGLVMWPKLFRRLVPYFLEGNINFDGLDAWLRVDPVNRDDRVLLPQLELGNMHDVIEASGTSIKLAYAPEDIVIVPDDYILAKPPEKPRLPEIGSLEIRIVAALVNTIGPERGNETVSLLNTTANTLDLSGLTIVDKDNGSFALTGMLEAGETLRVKLTKGPRLSNTKDSISLMKKEAIIDQVHYEKNDLPQEGETIVF